MALFIILAVPFILFSNQKNKEQLEEVATALYEKVIERPEFVLDALSVEGASIA